MYALKELDTRRIERISSVEDTHKAEFAQYLTPVEIASFMARTTMRYFQPNDTIDILDPGAGTGILSCSMVNELVKHGMPSINLDAFEIDKSIIGELKQSYQSLRNNGNINYQIYDKNFITDVGFELAWGKGKKYDIIVMNPPYKKINTRSIYKNVLYDIGIDTVNTYSAFMAIGIKMLKENGILTAIVPRSFCNGLYFLPFRKMIYDTTSIKHLHIFESRKDNFKDENVLQENVIIILQKTTNKSDVVTITYSKEKKFTGYQEKNVSYNNVIDTNDKQYYISIPSYEQKITPIPLKYTHQELGFDISTGPIVDFRMKEKLLFDSEGVPLLYSVHIRNQNITWPLASKKLVESVTSHGPIDSKRKIELEKLFETKLTTVYVTAFPDRKTFTRFTAEIAWETEVWLADNPSHLIHFNGDKFLG